MKKSHSHMHVRNYLGEWTASVLVDWLNSPRRPSRDPVEQLLHLNADLPSSEEKLERYLADLVRRSKFAVAPIVADLQPNLWKVDWRMVGRMDPEQGLALSKLLHLAEQGLLGRIRKCAKKECGQWFYARFEHQRFHAKKCQVETFRSDPDWKRERREYMKRLRQTKKLQERTWQGRKGKR